MRRECISDEVLAAFEETQNFKSGEIDDVLVGPF
jgi:hypothetical protein